ncbi:flagellar assembly protein H [Escherichia albertii]|nr:flagellar assembly protein H [Escherichia albertii]
MTIETLRGRYRLHRFPPRQRAVSGEPLAASISAADYQRQLMDGFQEGLQKGFAQGMTEGQEQGFSEGHQQGFAEGRRQGYTEGSLAGQQEGRKQFTQAAQPLEAISGKVNDFLAHIERKQREDLLQLVEKVTRQVIRCELALQPTQLLALVEEALAAFPAMPETLQVMLSTEEFNRLRDAVPEKVSEWGLTPSPDLPPGECRVITDKSELDIGCEHRPEHQQSARALKQNYAAYMEIKPLIPLGGYVAGADASVDKAVKMFPAIERFLRQEMRESASLELVQSRLQILFPGVKKAEQ